MARILALTSRVPYPPREGHQLRSFHLLRALASVHRVHLLSCVRRDDALDETGPLREMLAGFEVFPIPVEHSRTALMHALAKSLLTRSPFVVCKYATPGLRRRLSALLGDFDLVHIDMLPLMMHADLVPATIPLVLNAHNVEHALLERRIEVEQRSAARAFLRKQLPRLRGFERAACRRASAVLACSPTDAEQLCELAPMTPIYLVPNGVDLDANRPSDVAPSEQAGMVFVGQMGWFPNRDGVEWFFGEVLPRILAARPDARFVLVGKPDGLRVPAQVAAQVRLAGFVADVRPPVLNAAVYVVPLRAGSGTRLKILEAMALGKAIVTTRIGAEGIGLTDGTDAVFADTAGDFANAVVRLLATPDEAACLGANARKLAESCYGWNAIGNEMLSHYSRLLAHDPSHSPQ